MLKPIHTAIFTCLIGIIFSCKESMEPSESQNEIVSIIPKVKTLLVKESLFSISISSNGKLDALEKVDLKFENVGLIQKIMVNNGDLVKQGQTIAYQKASYLLSEKKRDVEILNKAWLNMEDILLGLGYTLKDTLSIPKDIMSMAKSRAGIAEANNQIIQTNKKYADSKLVAPFSGIIASMEAKENNLSSTTDKICTLINNSTLFASFYIMENEFGLISKGDIVKIISITLPNKTFMGKVKYINPTVNENGLVLVKAIIDNEDRLLIDGMNVNILIQKHLDRVISVPKSALVDRQGRKVIFTFDENKSKSKWSYVMTGYESRDSIIVTEGLNIGERIIVDGHVNLAHNTEVELVD